MAEFVVPEFLQNHSTDEIHKMMKDALPADLDVSEGSHAWNLTRPTALICAEICEFILPQVIQLIFPEWAYGSFLDGHAQARGITRLAATAAVGEITITGEIGAIIPAGSVFSTASVNDEPSVDYETIEEAKIPDSGSVTVGVRCTKTGTVGNATLGTITMASSKLTGITGVTNEEEITGGTEVETDEQLQKRIAENDKSQGESFTGTVADYRRWAKSVPGVGEATVIPAQDTGGVVTIILTDANGAPATEQLCADVYNYIMKPDDPGSRLAPINATLVVQAPATVSLGVMATIELEAETTIESAKAAFARKLAEYLPIALDDGEIKYTKIGSLLSGSDGVNDYSDLQIGLYSDGAITYGTGNLSIDTNQLPVVEDDYLVLTSGTV